MLKAVPLDTVHTHTHTHTSIFKKHIFKIKRKNKDPCCGLRLLCLRIQHRFFEYKKIKCRGCCPQRPAKKERISNEKIKNKKWNNTNSPSNNNNSNVNTSSSNNKYGNKWRAI